MSFSFFTTTADPGQKSQKTSSILLSWCLMLLWIILIGFGVVSIFEPKWLQELSRSGIIVESQDYKNYGDNLMRQGNPRLAIPQYLYALKIKPDFPGVLVNLGTAYVQVGEPELGIEVLKEALKFENSPKGSINFNLGVMSEKSGRIDQAIQYYWQALGSEHEQSVVYGKLGDLYLKAKRYDEAEMAFQQALEIQTDPCTDYRRMLRRNTIILHDDLENKSIVEEQLALGIGIEDMSPYDIDLIRKLQEENPAISQTHNYLGMAYANLGDINGAVTQFQRAVSIWPENPEAKKNLESAKTYQKRLLEVDDP